MIEKRKNLLIQQDQLKKFDEDENDAKGMCFVDILLRSTINGESLPNEQILSEAQTFMIAVSITVVI